MLPRCTCHGAGKAGSLLPSLVLQSLESRIARQSGMAQQRAAVPAMAEMFLRVSDSFVPCGRSVAERPMISEGGAKLHFVDDRFETVEAIAADPYLSALPKFQTYFASWCAAERVSVCWHWNALEFDHAVCPKALQFSTCC